MKNKFSKFTADTSFEIVQECIDDKTDHQNNCIHVFCLQFSVALETVKNSEYDQELHLSQTADNPMAP